ncbi:DNA phosphorothioation-associated putative methyltransferase [Paraburkholderia caledonica]|uniref:DNA phosphorothioation-associated putative methyltransferase n=1 Tax=Paraburkholderia caledonica TaxID=134536 RepID=UPI000DEECEB8|nr:DNA phosphorothioation-associated putative methyltransferase [Paraburkholderia caledonica]AXF12994.1 peptidase m15a [Paraburkholderia caledonica]
MISGLGKIVVDDLYIHRDTVAELKVEHRAVVESALDRAPDDARNRANVVKLNLKTHRVSLLAYCDFFEAPFPSLVESWSVEHEGRSPVGYRRYAESLNPPILHRKELLLSVGHPLRPAFSNITRQAEDLGLFDNTAVIGFRLNWEQLIAEKGYRLEGERFLPLGNAEVPELITGNGTPSSGPILRHLTALSRSGLSAPVQLLIRHGLLQLDSLFFDYGCGRGDDMAALRESGYSANGWDPHYAPDNPVTPADVVNLGFVLNVIEDPAERVEALQRAFSITKRVMSVGVMLRDARVTGQPFGDGWLTSRNTFQKYFSQDEIKDYLEQVLQREAFPVGPGVLLAFADNELEQRFLANRYRARGIGRRLVALAKVEAARVRNKPLITQATTLSEAAHPLLDRLWETALDLGRLPERDEVEFAVEIEEKLGTFVKTMRALRKSYDFAQLHRAALVRTDDLRLFFAMQCFAKRAPYHRLEIRLQRDIKAFFGTYRVAHAAGMGLLLDAANPESVKCACEAAAEIGLGWLDPEHALLLHVSMVEQLPALLRAYVGCGLLLYGDAAEVQLVKIHSSSGKLTLMQFENFDCSPLPQMVRRVKINIRTQKFDVFEYGNEYEKPLLYYRSRYLGEEYPGYAEQYAFDQALAALALFDPLSHGMSAHEFYEELEKHRLSVEGFELVRSRHIPELDKPCGSHFTYRDFVECGDTQQRLGIANLPRNPETYNALHDLATNILDPLIEYFGPIRLTYGFCSHELGKHIKLRVAPALDQHAALERDLAGRPICDRGGAACDFIVDDEDMGEVANWIMENLPFDRLYFYGDQLSIHVSHSPDPAGKAYELTTGNSGRRTPRPFRRR